MAEHAVPSDAQIAAVVAELQLIGAPEPTAGGLLPAQRIDIVVWCPMIAPLLYDALAKALPSSRTCADYVAAGKLAACNKRVMLWVNASGAPLAVRARSPFETFSADKPANRVFICTSSGLDKPRPTLAGPHTCNSDALAQLDLDGDFAASVIRVLHWDRRELAPALAKHAMVVTSR